MHRYATARLKKTLSTCTALALTCPAEMAGGQLGALPLSITVSVCARCELVAQRALDARSLRSSRCVALRARAVCVASTCACKGSMVNHGFRPRHFCTIR
jgi:hypothetical protein